MNYQVLPGREKEFEAVFVKVHEIMRSMNGHVKTHLYRDVSDPLSYVIFSEWSSKPAFEAFTSSTQFRNVTNWGKEQILAARPQHKIYGDLDSASPVQIPEAVRSEAAAGGCPVHKH
jgi:heme-degrading monooxygenase HmoA